jgi:hypothetical protein
MSADDQPRRNSRGLEIWASSNHPELKKIEDDNPQRCTCDDFSFRHTVGLHMRIEAHAEHAPDPTPEMLEKLRKLLGY